MSSSMPSMSSRLKRPRHRPHPRLRQSATSGIGQYVSAGTAIAPPAPLLLYLKNATHCVLSSMKRRTEPPIAIKEYGLPFDPCREHRPLHHERGVKRKSIPLNQLGLPSPRRQRRAAPVQQRSRFYAQRDDISSAVDRTLDNAQVVVSTGSVAYRLDTRDVDNSSVSFSEASARCPSPSCSCTGCTPLL